MPSPISSSSQSNKPGSFSQSNSPNIANDWNEKDFSVSSNSLLKDLAKRTANNIIDLIWAYSNYPQVNRNDAQINASRTTLMQLGSYLEKSRFDINKLPSYSTGKLARIALDNVRPVPLNSKEKKIVIRLFIAAIILDQFETIYTLLGNAREFKDTVIETLRLLGEELINESPSVKLQDYLTETGVRNWKKLFDDPDDEFIEATNISDNPAAEDVLSRRALAKYLAKRLNFIYKNHVTERGAFFMHIDGAWGSGKSTLLNFMREYLTGNDKKENDTGPPPAKDEQWIVIDFDAWANQRLNPPWWFIMKAVYRGSKQALWNGGEYGRFAGLWLREHFWRLNTGTNYLLMAIVTAIIAVVALSAGIGSKTGFNSLNVIQLISFVTFVWSSTKFLNTSLVPASANAARNFIESNGSDPMSVLAKHFKKQVRYINKPITVFIDNLDRCNQEYGIHLLEGLQTIFREAPIVYVVAADRKWLGKMYENQYGNFADAVAKPGKPFGLIFLDKIFQYIVELPHISSVQKLGYWNYLLNGGTINGQDLTAKRKEIRRNVETKFSNKEKIQMARSTVSNDLESQIVREEVISSLSIGEEQRMLEKKLSDFYDIVEPNPRAMKRIINDISTLRAITILYSQKVNIEPLVLFTILKLQYPKLSEFFWNNPEKLEEVHKATAVITGDRSLDDLLLQPEVKRIFNYTNKNNICYKIDTDFIRRMKFEKQD